MEERRGGGARGLGKDLKLVMPRIDSTLVVCSSRSRNFETKKEYFIP